MSKVVTICHVTKTLVNDSYFKNNVTQIVVDDYGLKFLKIVKTVVGELQF